MALLKLFIGGIITYHVSSVILAKVSPVRLLYKLLDYKICDWVGGREHIGC